MSEEEEKAMVSLIAVEDEFPVLKGELLPKYFYLHVIRKQKQL